MFRQSAYKWLPFPYSVFVGVGDCSLTQSGCDFVLGFASLDTTNANDDVLSHRFPIEITFSY